MSSSITNYQKVKESLKSNNNTKQLAANLKQQQNKWQEMRNNYYLPANKQFRQNLQIMILCSQRPVKITAFKFSTLSLQSFTAILSTSMSYFTLLQTVYNENKEEQQDVLT